MFGLNEVWKTRTPSHLKYHVEHLAESDEIVHCEAPAVRAESTRCLIRI